MINGLVPFVHVRSVERSIAFYETLGFAVNDTFEPDGTVAWAFLEHEQARIMLDARRRADRRRRAGGRLLALRPRPRGLPRAT